MNLGKSLKSYIRGHRVILLIILCFCALGIVANGDVVDVFRQTRDKPNVASLPPKDTDKRIHLIHSDVLYKNWEDPNAEVLVGNVRLSHDGVLMFCDSARFYRDDNSFHAYGKVKMLQGDTLSLLSDTLLYDGNDFAAEAMGHVVLTHNKSRLETNHLYYYRQYPGRFDREEDKGIYVDGGTLYDEGSVLVSDWGQYLLTSHESFFTDNVELTNPNFKLVSDTLYYNTETKKARIESPTNIIAKDGTFVYGKYGEYDTRTGEAHLTERSYIIRDMRSIVGDTLFYDKNAGYSEAHGNVEIRDSVNQCILLGDYCLYDENTGYAMATDRALAKEYSSGDTVFIHADTLKIFSYNMGTDSLYRNMHAYKHVRLYRTDVQGVCDSLVSLTRDSCTYLYGQPIVWNESQQLFGQEIRVYNNDSTLTWMHVINHAMTIQQVDSASYNQVASKEMFTYFKDGQVEHTEAHGNVYVVYYMDEKDSTRIGMNYTETSKMFMYMDNKKISKIWMPAATGEIYPVGMIPPNKKTLEGFAWFDYIRPKDKNDVFVWRSKPKDAMISNERTKEAPLQKLENIKNSERKRGRTKALR